MQRRECRYVPKTAVSNRSKTVALFNHLVGASEQRRRHFEAEHLRGLEIDHELKLGRLLNWKVAELLALEDAIDVLGRAPILVNYFGPIGDQSAVSNHVAKGIDGWQPMSGGQCDDQLAMNCLRRTSCHNQAAVRLVRECGDGPFDFSTITHVDRAQLHPKRGRHGLDSPAL